MILDSKGRPTRRVIGFLRSMQTEPLPQRRMELASACAASSVESNEDDGDGESHELHRPETEKTTL